MFTDEERMALRCHIVALEKERARLDKEIMEQRMPVIFAALAQRKISAVKLQRLELELIAEAGKKLQNRSKIMDLQEQIADLLDLEI